MRSSMAACRVSDRDSENSKESARAVEDRKRESERAMCFYTVRILNIRVHGVHLTHDDDDKKKNEYTLIWKFESKSNFFAYEKANFI